MKSASKTLIIFSATIALAASAIAADQGNGRRACRDDVQSFCKDVEPGGGRIIQCLRQHSDQLSDGCRSAIEKLAAHRQGHGESQSAPPSQSDDNQDKAAPDSHSAD